MVTFHLPTGPLNIQPLFPGVNFENIEEYYLQIRNKSDSTYIATTNTFTRDECCDSVVRIFFVNYLGGIDAVSFKIVSMVSDVKSTRWKKPLKYPLQKFDGGYQRSNIIASDQITGETNSFDEVDMEWLEELIATPNAWIQWAGTQGQEDDYLPVVIEDTKFIKRKYDDRYDYTFQIVFTLANDKILVRN